MASPQLAVVRNAIWQWPRKFKKRPDLRVRHKLPNESDFEYEARRLNLDANNFWQLVSSIPLRFWAKRNAHRRYVPEELLNAWGIVPVPKPIAKRRRRNHVRRNITKERRALEKQADALVREIVYLRDGHRCVKCGTDKALTPSHIRPRGKCPRMTWFTCNVLTMCAACHLYWWHKDPIATITWLTAKYPGLYERLLLWERVSPKVDMKQLLIELEAELRDLRAEKQA